MCQIIMYTIVKYVNTYTCQIIMYAVVKDREIAKNLVFSTENHVSVDLVSACYGTADWWCREAPSTCQPIPWTDLALGTVSYAP